MINDYGVKVKIVFELLNENNQHTIIEKVPWMVLWLIRHNWRTSTGTFSFSLDFTIVQLFPTVHATITEFHYLENSKTTLLFYRWRVSKVSSREIQPEPRKSLPRNTRLSAAKATTWNTTQKARIKSTKKARIHSEKTRFF